MTYIPANAVVPALGALFNYTRYSNEYLAFEVDSNSRAWIAGGEPAHGYLATKTRAWARILGDLMRGQTVYVSLRPSTTDLGPEVTEYPITPNGYSLFVSNTSQPNSIAFDSTIIEEFITEGEVPESSGDLVVTHLTGPATGFSSVRPTEEALAGLPAGARPYAETTVITASLSGRRLVLEGDEAQWTESTSADLVSAEGLINSARDAWRLILTNRLRQPEEDPEEELRRARHRNQTARNFAAFTGREGGHTTEELVGTLPFVPHGLASSRRWGIEVESGGARGIPAPADWVRTRDGSLRSAYEGWVEVQDFEPFDEEVTERVRWESCVNSQRHIPHEEYYDTERGEYIYRIREDFLPASECEACGEVTNTYHRTPQTIHHEAQYDDCAEFVSPILVSMHSAGLEEITTAMVGRPQNDTAGVHVHVEASDLSQEQIATLVYGYDLLEPLLEASYRRTEREYCRRRGSDEVLAAARVARGRGMGFSPDGGSRYVTLNTHALHRHGTIEFRGMGAVYEYDYLVRWAMLCRELVNAVAAGATNRDFAKIRTWEDLLAFLARFGKEYVRAAVYEMTGEVGEVAKLLKEDRPVTTEALDADFQTWVDTLVGLETPAQWATVAADTAQRTHGVTSHLVPALAGAET